MKVKLIMLVLCFSIAFVVSSCKEVRPRTVSGCHGAFVYDTSVYFYFTNAYSKNKKQEILLAFWDNDPKFPIGHASGMMDAPPNIECNLTRSDTVKFQCIGKLNGNTGKGEVKINGEKFDVSNGRLFLINTLVKPIKIIQVNEQFNSPPFNDLPDLGLPFTNKKRISKKEILNIFSACDKKFEYLAKHNKTVADFLKQSIPKSVTPNK